MTLKIFGIAASRALRPLWAAEELGIDYEHVPLHYNDPVLKQEPFLSLNPNGTLPAIDDHGCVLFESLAITLHLARTRPDGGLWTSDVQLQSQIIQWTLWAATEAEPLARQWFHHTTFLPPEQRRPEVADAAFQHLRKRLQVLDQQVRDQPYLLPCGFTVADLNVAAVLQRLPQLGGADFPHALAWHQRCMDRPAIRRVMSMRKAT